MIDLKDISTGQYIGDSATSLTLLATKGNLAVTGTAASVNVYIESYRYCVDLAKEFERKLRYKFSHPNTFFFFKHLFCL